MLWHYKVLIPAGPLQHKIFQTLMTGMTRYIVFLWKYHHLVLEILYLSLWINFSPIGTHFILLVFQTIFLDQIKHFSTITVMEITSRNFIMSLYITMCTMHTVQAMHHSYKVYIVPNSEKMDQAAFYSNYLLSVLRDKCMLHRTSPSL